MTKKAFELFIWLILQVVHADYVRSDQLAQVWASNDANNFENTTEEVKQRRFRCDSSWNFKLRNIFDVH